MTQETILTPTQAEVLDDSKQALRNQVQHIAEQLTNGFGDDDLNDDGEPMTAWDYMSDVLDIRYMVDSQKRYLGARILVAFGGPNIWIDTENERVEGYWWGDKFTASYNDGIGLNDTCEEYFNCL